MSATWTVLGAGAILARPGYGPSGHALRPAEGAPVTLFDCGPGTLRALPAAGIALGEVRRVVISHFHPDHCLDLLAIAFARHNPAFEDAPPIELVGPRGLGEWLAGAARALGRWVAFRDARVLEVAPSADPAPLDPGAGGPGDGLALSSIRTRHTDTSLAWRAELPGGAAVVYSGDSPEVPELAEIARGARLFVCECSFPDGEGPSNHLTPSGAGRLAREAGVARLVLTHFYPPLDPEEARAVAARVFGGPVEAARDGSVHAIE